MEWQTIVLISVAFLVGFSLGDAEGLVRGWLQALRHPPRESFVWGGWATLKYKGKVLQWPKPFEYIPSFTNTGAKPDGKDNMPRIVKVFVQATKPTSESYNLAYKRMSELEWTMRQAYEAWERENPTHEAKLQDPWDTFKKAMNSRKESAAKNLNSGE